MAKHREEAILSLRKGAISQVINNKRYSNLNTNKSNNFMINPQQLNPEWLAYYNNLDQVKINNHSSPRLISSNKQSKIRQMRQNYLLCITLDRFPVTLLIVPMLLKKYQKLYFKKQLICC